MAIFKNCLLLVAVYASCTTGSTDIINFQNDLLSNSFSESDIFSSTNDNILDSTSLSLSGNEASGIIVGSLNSSPASIIHAQATAEAISETAAAKTARANAAAQAKMNALRMSAAQLNADKKQNEAEMRTQAAAVHMAKASAATERKMRAETEERNEIAAARQEQEMADRLKQAAAQILSVAQEESKTIQANIAKLQREALNHDNKADAARARAQAAKASMDAGIGLQVITSSSGGSSGFSQLGGLTADSVSSSTGGLFNSYGELSDSSSGGFSGSSDFGSVSGMSDFSSSAVQSSDTLTLDGTTQSSTSVSFSDSAVYSSS